MKHIKYLVICIKASDRAFRWCAVYVPEMEEIIEKLEHIVKPLLLLNVKLKPFEVRLANTFNGQLGCFLRESLKFKERLEDGSFKTVLVIALPNRHLIDIAQTEVGDKMWLGSMEQLKRPQPHSHTQSQG